MKYLLTFLLLLFLFSCEKESRCWICDITVSKYVGDNPNPMSINSFITEPCDVSIYEYKKEHSSKVTQRIDGITVTTIMECECSEK
jgi:hypothetical protein